MNSVAILVIATMLFATCSTSTAKKHRRHKKHYTAEAANPTPAPNVVKIWAERQ